ncbi:50S ribosomal protein L25/general stress protein Ctc [Mangrovactinospora gilvigrisea]|uniref:Large ribosomal subunit protein bL25 n=1 Tax=Mangrovactinospora gilvigrisea TaxID=1428644 RepID=A0A1J7BJL2_9ACTN|nr:50S ribosomal protein L25/general stress protein Ctc [Mangrovactinospora gilvigrisea]OIV38871.1 50S ribosomal protein L25/general stress protein Ctc [Mangrovactinospora gilvigrisea]
MAAINIPAKSRTEFGKGASRRLRAESRVPAVVYGHGSEPVHLHVPGHELMMALKNSNALIELQVEGGDNQLVLPKAVQRDVLKGFLEHVDFLVVKRGEKVTVEAPIHVEGELASGPNLLEHVLNTLPIEAEATHIPESVTVSVEGLAAGDAVQAKDITLPEGVSLAIEGDDVVLQVVAAQAEEAPAEEAEEAAAEGEEAAEA